MTTEQLQLFCQNTLVSHLGIEFLEITSDTLSAKMPVDKRTCQPFGFLHGGASLALLETVGSGISAVNINTDEFYIFGMNVTANHIKPATNGYVYATAKFLHKGNNTHVVNISITDEEGALICDGRITNIIIPK